MIKKKIKDLTIKGVRKICKKYHPRCQNCPLSLLEYNKYFCYCPIHIIHTASKYYLYKEIEEK